RAREAPDEIADERGGDHHWPRRDEPHRYRVEELPLGQPVVLHNHALTEEGDDGKAASEDERPRLEEEQSKRKERGRGRRPHGHGEVGWRRSEEHHIALTGQPLYEPWRRVPQHHHETGGDEQ